MKNKWIGRACFAIVICVVIVIAPIFVIADADFLGSNEPAAPETASNTTEVAENNNCRKEHCNEVAQNNNNCRKDHCNEVAQNNNCRKEHCNRHGSRKHCEDHSMRDCR